MTADAKCCGNYVGNHSLPTYVINCFSRLEREGIDVKCL